MTVKQRAFPSPIADPDTEQFWSAAKNGKLMVGSCNSCGEKHYYPRGICPHSVSYTHLTLPTTPYV